MYKTTKPSKSLLRINNALEGETIEQKIERIVTNGEPMSDGSATIYTERNEGVKPEYNPRTDKWDIAIEAMDKITKTKIAKREGNAKMDVIEGGKKEGKSDQKGGKDGGAEPIQGTSTND